MPYADPTKQREAMALLGEERKRATTFYRALLNAYLDPELSPRLYRMVRAELAWLEQRGLPIPKWPAERERELTGRNGKG